MNDTAPPLPPMPPLAGVSLATVPTAIGYEGRDDILMASFDGFQFKVLKTDNRRLILLEVQRETLENQTKLK